MTCFESPASQQHPAICYNIERTLHRCPTKTTHCTDIHLTWIQTSTSKATQVLWSGRQVSTVKYKYYISHWFVAHQQCPVHSKPSKTSHPNVASPQYSYPNSGPSWQSTSINERVSDPYRIQLPWGQPQSWSRELKCDVGLLVSEELRRNGSVRLPPLLTESWSPASTVVMPDAATGGEEDAPGIGHHLETSWPL